MRHARPEVASARARWALSRAVPALAAAALTLTVLTGTVGAGTGPSYVALGDSYTAAPLVPSLTGSPAGCARSTHDYPALVAAAVGASSFRDVSCQGATTGNMAKPQDVPLGTNPPQLDALSPDTALVTLQIGGNDIGFASIVINCATRSFLNPFGSPCKRHYTAPDGTDELRAAVDKTAPKVAAVLEAIHKLAPNARVLLLGYPDILPNSGDGCWPRVPVAYGDVPYLRGIEAYLNHMLATQAAAGRARYVGTYVASIGHDFCQETGIKWIEGILPTSPAAPVHPNALGEGDMAVQVEAALG